MGLELVVEELVAKTGRQCVEKLQIMSQRQRFPHRIIFRTHSGVTSSANKSGHIPYISRSQLSTVCRLSRRWNFLPPTNKCFNIIYIPVAVLSSEHCKWNFPRVGASIILSPGSGLWGQHPVQFWANSVDCGPGKQHSQIYVTAKLCFTA